MVADDSELSQIPRPELPRPRPRIAAPISPFFPAPTLPSFQSPSLPLPSREPLLSLLIYTATMAPLGDQLVDQLKGTVDKLEARVAELEARLQGKASASSSSPQDGMRMILMGPPGAGMLFRGLTPWETDPVLTTVSRQAREPKRRESRTSTASVTWLVSHIWRTTHALSIISGEDPG